MKEFGKKLEFNIFFDLRSNNKVKIMDYHLIHPYIAFCNEANGFSIWDYELKTCLKSFNANMLESKDLTKQVIIRDIKFFDKETLSVTFPSMELAPPSDDRQFFYQNNWIIVITENKIFFYDYVCEKIENISPIMLDSKSPRCIDFIDTRYLAIGCDGGIIKIFDTANWIFVKTLKGYHQKNITHMISLKNEDDPTRNRILAASNDGTIALWSIEQDNPVMRFQATRGGKPVKFNISQKF